MKHTFAQKKICAYHQMMHRATGLYARMLCAFFELADKNSDGSLEMTELAHVCQNLENVQWIMNIADKDKSGNLSLDEWFAYVKCLAKQSQQAASAVLQAYEERLRENPDIVSVSEAG